MSAADKWCTLLTAPGPAGIAVLRLVGSAADDFLRRHVRFKTPDRALAPGSVARATLHDADGTILDDILVTAHTRVGQTEWRLHLHGNPVLVEHCRTLASQFATAREQHSPSPEPRGNAHTPLVSNTADAPAPPLWSAADGLAQDAFAVLPSMRTIAGARWLLAQADLLRVELTRLLNAPSAEQIAACKTLAADAARVTWYATPMRVALVGAPNAGKSTLINALADRPVSIVSERPGTTRDWVAAEGEAGGFPVLWIDTAGVRETSDALEHAGIAATRATLQSADAIIAVLDATAPESWPAVHAALDPRRPAAVAISKVDLTEPGTEFLPSSWRGCEVAVSAPAQLGLAELQHRLIAATGRPPLLAAAGAFHPRQVAWLQEFARERRSYKAAYEAAMMGTAGPAGGDNHAPRAPNSPPLLL